MAAHRAQILSLALSVLVFPALPARAQGDISQPPTDKSVVPFSDPNVGLTGQKNPTADLEGKVRFRSQSILVQVPIIATDKSGNHLHGLTRDDFKILENGKEQKIATFDEIKVTASRLATAPARPGEISNLTLSDDHPRAVSIILLDTINTPFLNQSTSSRALIKYLSGNLDSGQVSALMVLTSHGVRVLHSLTDDQQQFIRLLQQSGGELTAMLGMAADTQANAALGDIPDVPMIANRPFVAASALVAHGDTLTAQFLQQQAIEQTPDGLLEVAFSLSGVPGRKSLIWATGGLPFEINAADQIPGAGLGALYERVVQALDAAQISVYPVDVRGLVDSDTSAAVRAASGPETAHSISNQAAFQTGVIAGMETFAAMTGGRAFYNTNDLASSFRQPAEDESSYYLAGYYLDTHSRDPGWRSLKIRLDRKDSEVRAREGFFVTNTTMNPEATRDSELLFALTSPIDGTGVPLTVRWLPLAGSGPKKKADFVLHLPPGAIAIEASNGQKHVTFDFAATAYMNDAKGSKPVANISKAVATVVPDAQFDSLRSNGIDMKNSLELPAGHYLVRVVVRDGVNGKIGSVTAPLTVN